MRDERGVYERLCLEGFQSGLSWLTILRKRPAFRAAFAGFDPDRVARFGERDVERLLGDAGIVRHRGKIEAAIANARATVALRAGGEPLPELFWASRPAAHPAGVARRLAGVDAGVGRAREAAARAGFRFVGPTTVYAAMQACGVVNDHLADCWVRDDVERERSSLMLDDHVRAVLPRLEEETERDDPTRRPRCARSSPAVERRAALRALPRAPGCEVLEIGGSRGYSTIWLGAAVRMYGGHVTSSSEPRQARASARNIADAGLEEWIDVIPGDAFGRSRSSRGRMTSSSSTPGSATTRRSSSSYADGSRPARSWSPTTSSPLRARRVLGRAAGRPGPRERHGAARQRPGGDLRLDRLATIGLTAERRGPEDGDFQYGQWRY